MYKEYERMSITDMFHPGSVGAPGERIIRGNAVTTVHSARPSTRYPVLFGHYIEDGRLTVPPWAELNTYQT